MLKRTPTYKIVKSALVSVLYLAFFTVQLFFNFDLHGAVNKKPYTNTASSASKIERETSFVLRPFIISKSNNRLNKRFEPESIPECIVPSVFVSFSYYEPEILGSLYRITTLSIFPHTIEQRGPPCLHNLI
ncbi:MAG: hypothetical protein K2Q21_04470 [Chitinophagaceae bacterium]|nr:hypothetical protein [Chitinophagaceae bacterium]